MILSTDSLSSLWLNLLRMKRHKLALCRVRCGLQDLRTQVRCHEMQLICPVILHILAQSQCRKSPQGNIFKRLPDGSVQAAWAQLDLFALAKCGYSIQLNRKPVKSLEHWGAPYREKRDSAIWFSMHAFVTTILLVIPWLGHSRYLLHIKIYKERDKCIWKHVKCRKKYLLISYGWHCFCVSNFRLWLLLFFYFPPPFFFSVVFILLYFITWFYLYFVKGIQKRLLQGAVKRIFKLQK